MPGQIDEETKLTWRDELMELQQEVAFDKAQDMQGRVVTAMVEGQVSGENVYVARTYGDAPDVDGYLFLHTQETLMSGDFVKAKVTGASEYYLIGEIFDEFAK